MTLSRIWRGCVAAMLTLGLTCPAWAGDPNVPGSVITQATGAQSGTTSWPAVPIGPANPLYVRGTGTGALALDASIQSLITTLNQPLSLPTGAATSGLQTTGNTTLSSILSALSSPLSLPTGAATASLQSSGNTSLSSILSGMATATNQTTGNTSLATIATNSAPQVGAAASATVYASAAVESGHIIKAAAGNLYKVYGYSSAGGLLMVFNSPTIPTDGAVTPIECVPVGAGGFGSHDLGNVPDQYPAGISVAFSTGSNCFSKTASTTAFFKVSYK